MMTIACSSSLVKRPAGKTEWSRGRHVRCEASLLSPDGSRLRIEANADAHIRASLADDGVQLHILSQCPLAPVLLVNGARITGGFAVRLIPA
jgi:hypothetical protein